MSFAQAILRARSSFVEGNYDVKLEVVIEPEDVFRVQQEAEVVLMMIHHELHIAPTSLRREGRRLLGVLHEVPIYVRGN